MWPYSADQVEKLHLETGTFCNLECPGCLRTFDNTAQSHLNTNFLTYKKVSTWFQPNVLPSVNKVIYSGQIDEPAANPEIKEITEYFLDNWSLKVLIMQSHGSIRTENFWTELGNLSRESGHIFRVEFSIDGLEDSNHIYRQGSNWHRIINNVNAYIQAGGYASWKFIKFKHNEHQVDQALELSKKLGFKQFVTVDSARPSSKEINTPFDFKSNDSVKCRAFDDKWLYVHYDGVLQPCCYFGYDERSDDPEDNLNHNTIDNYFSNSKFLHDLQDGWDTPSCNPRCYTKCKLNLRDNRTVYE